MDAPILQLRDVRKRFSGEEGWLLDGIDLEIRPGARIAITGPSGCGKSTLLAILGLLERASRGRVEVEGRDTMLLSEDARAAIRRDTLGFVFQEHHLLPHLSALDNVLLAVRADRRPAREDTDRALHLLERLELADRIGHRPGELSSGQRQRVAVARALVRRPKVLLADEPTGALDPARARALVQLLLEVGDDAALVVVTHDLAVAGALREVYELHEGRIQLEPGGA